MTKPRSATTIKLHELSFMEDDVLTVVQGTAVRGMPNPAVSKARARKAIGIFRRVQRYLNGRVWYARIGVTIKAERVSQTLYTEKWMPLEQVPSMVWKRGNKTFRVMLGNAPQLRKHV